MNLTPGTRLGPYEIVALLGAGGMGEVHRARDTRLARDVAIKALPAAVAQDPEHLARFEREAKLLASLSHPNIAGILGVEEVGDARYLVLEYIDGETLADRIARGPLPVDEAMEIGRQVAAGVEAAHENGIVHRDLKPGNVMLRPDGSVKVLDFGLAKAGATDRPGSDPRASASPLLTYAATEVGIVLGTAAYMSPEQARGRPVDKRSDVWSFGCLLYECLTGRQAFRGETVSDTIASILTAEPDLTAVPAATPPRVRALLARCLTRDPRERLRDIGEARIALAAGAAEPIAAAPQKGRAGASVGLQVFAAIVAALAGVVATKLVSRPPRPESFTLSVLLPPGQRLQGGLESGVVALAPDGRALVYAAQATGPYALWYRPFDSAEARPLAGTEEGHNPFFSPDGEWVAFFASGKLRKVSVRGGLPVDLADVGADRGGVWLPDDTIVFSPSFSSPLMRIPANGGKPVAITSVDSTHGERSHRWPCALPGGKWVVFTVGTIESPGNYEDARIEAVSLSSGERRAVARGSYARFAPPRHLVFAREGTLYALRLDPRNPRGGATPEPVHEGVLGEPTSGAAFFDIAREGTLIAVPGKADRDERRLAWFDLEGRVTPVPAEARAYQRIDLSPDGTTMLTNVGPGSGGDTDVFTVDLARGTPSQLTFDHQCETPVWLPDGRRAAWTRRNGLGVDILIGDAAGRDSARLVATWRSPVAITDVSPDGRDLFFTEFNLVDSDVFAVATDGASPPRRAVAYPRAQAEAAVSPDGRWVAYVTDESGQREVWVQPLGRAGGRMQVSRAGGVQPTWAPDGRTLYFVEAGGLVAAPLRVAGDAIATDSARRLFDLPAMGGDWSRRSFDVHPTGTKFLVRIPPADRAERREIAVLPRWSQTSEFTKRAVR